MRKEERKIQPAQPGQPVSCNRGLSSLQLTFVLSLFSKFCASTPHLSKSIGRNCILLKGMHKWSFHIKSLFPFSLTETASDKVCPDLTITEVEDENNEERNPIRADGEGILANKIEQTPLREIKNTNTEQERILTDDTKTVMEDQPDQERNVLEPGSENQGLTSTTYELENPDQQTVTDNTNENIEPVSLLEEQNERNTTAKILSDENGTTEASAKQEDETDIGNENTKSLSQADTNKEQLESEQATQAWR